ncbi:MAG: hypothetical protein ABSF50_12835 [Burkholderiaceae bacterium]|jgi:hypothetical protein
MKVTVTGQQSREEAFGVITTIFEEARRAGSTRVLVDARDVSNRLAPSDIYSIGERLADVFGSTLKVVLVYRVGFIDGFGETVAVNRGASFTVRHNEKEALDWLLGAEAEPT